MCDPYIGNYRVVKRLLQEYRKHDNLVIAFDFDNTIYDYHGTGDVYPRVIKLLKRCYDLGLTLVCYTGNDNIELIRGICLRNNFSAHYINESPIQGPSKPHKPYFSILLDDRCGLRSAVEDLERTLDEINSDKRKAK